MSWTWRKSALASKLITPHEHGPLSPSPASLLPPHSQATLPLPWQVFIASSPTLQILDCQRVQQTTAYLWLITIDNINILLFLAQRLLADKAHRWQFPANVLYGTVHVSSAFFMHFPHYAKFVVCNATRRIDSHLQHTAMHLQCIVDADRKSCRLFAHLYTGGVSLCHPLATYISKCVWLAVTLRRTLTDWAYSIPASCSCFASPIRTLSTNQDSGDKHGWTTELQPQSRKTTNVRVHSI